MTENNSIKTLIIKLSWHLKINHCRFTWTKYLIWFYLLVFTCKFQWGPHFYSWITIFKLQTCSDNPPLYRQLLGGYSSCAFQISQTLWNSCLLVFLNHWQRLLLSDVGKSLTHSTQFKADSDRLWAAQRSQSAATFKESFPQHTEVQSHRGAVAVCWWSTIKIKASCFTYKSPEEFNPSQLKLYMLLYYPQLV